MASSSRAAAGALAALLSAAMLALTDAGPALAQSRAGDARDAVEDSHARDSTSQDDARSQPIADSAASPQPAPQTAPDSTAPSETEPLRRRPGQPEEAPRPVRLPPLRAVEGDPFTAIPDRWRIMENLGVRERWFDPYNQNTLKADRPIQHLIPFLGPQWFLNLGVISDTLLEGRRIPVGVGGQATDDPDDLDVFGTGDQLIAAETVIVETSLLKGNTTFRPPDHEIRIVLAGQYNDLTVGERGIVNVNPNKGEHRSDGHFG
ncbi:MAG TPA: hypothetical protein VEL28_17080, partial [Candidatus Binatia bacterium]|nr:hypothetical protein [Candidatus Binatia bacterium]